MVGTILYVVNVERERRTGHSVLWFHVLGCLCGSAFIGGLLGCIGAILRAKAPQLVGSSSVLLITGAIATLYSFRESGLLKVPAPKLSRQVFSRWRLTLAPRKAAILYGLELGVGFTTYVTATTFYVVSLWALLVGSPLLGAFGMTAFGVGRALPLWLLSRRVTDTEERIQLSTALDRWKPVIHIVNGVALGFAGGCFIVAELSAP